MIASHCVRELCLTESTMIHLISRKCRIHLFSFCRFKSLVCSSCVKELLSFTSLEKTFRRELSDGVGNVDSKKWKMPSGHATEICIYNSVVKSKVPLVIRNKSYVSWYMCGPTVYDSAHLGHACCYVKFDIIRRILENVFNINVMMAMSVTDIDDKIIKRSKEGNEDITSVSSRYEAEFWKDMKSLNVIPPNAPLRVTKHIDEIISFIARIIDAGKAYRAVDGSVYFDTGSFDNYGKFVPISVEGMESDDDSSLYIQKSSKTVKCKRTPLDFALWKSSPTTDEPGWPSPWGRGRPGWHIECSAMASKLFGSKVDLHSGGVDLIFPHHENEEAQSCAHHGVSQWVNYWIHSGHLHLKGQEKMSKSLKNTLSIQEFLSSYTANQFRMFCLLSHYRSGVAYTEETMENAVAIMNKIECFLADASAYVLGKKEPVSLDECELEKCISKFEEKMQQSLADDFNTPVTMSALIELITYCNKILNPSHKLSEAHTRTCSNSAAPISSVATLIKRTLEKLGIAFKSDDVLNSQGPQPGIGYNVNMQQIIDSSVEFRSEVRDLTLDKLNECSKDDVGKAFCKNILDVCDKFRHNMATGGVTVKDHGKSSSWTIAEAEIKKKS